MRLMDVMSHKGSQPRTKGRPAMQGHLGGGGVGDVLWNRVVNQRLAEAGFAVTREWVTPGSWQEDVIGLFE